MIVYSRLYLRNFHYSQYFVIAHAHCKRVCWMLLGVMWINKISIYLSVGYYLCSIGGKTHRWRHQSALYHYKTNRFYVVVRLFSWVAHEAQPSVSLMFSPRCDIILIHCLTHARQHRIYSQIGLCSIDEISEQLITDCIFLLISKEFLADHYFVHFFTYFGRTFEVIAFPSKAVIKPCLLTISPLYQT